MTTFEADLHLVQRCVAGDTEAFTEIVRRYLSSVLATAFALTGDSAASEDVSQDTFLVAWQRMGQLENPERLRAWLCAIARNIVRSQNRSACKDPLHGAAEVSAEAYAAAAPGANDLAIAAERDRIVWSAISTIQEEYRLPLVLYYRENRSTREVADALDISEAAVRQRLSRARAMLRREVSALVEETLVTAKPSQMLVPMIVAAVASGASQGVAGTLAVGAAKATGGMAVGTAGLALAGSIAGPAIGIAGGMYAGYQEFKRAKTDEERSAIKRQMWYISLLVGGWGAVLVSIVVLAGLQMISPKAAFWLGLANICTYVVVLTWLLVVTNRKIRKIRGPAERPKIVRGNQRFLEQAERAPGQWRMNIISSYGGATFGSLGWIFAAAVVTAQFGLGALAAGFGLFALGVATWATLRRPERYWLHAGALAVVLAGFVFVARPHAWSPQIAAFLIKNQGWEWFSPNRFAQISIWLMLAMGAGALFMHWRGLRRRG